MSNTCGFDSLSQVFATAYCDSKSFQTYLESIISNEFITFVLHMIKKGACSSTYKKRAECFLTWPRTELAQGLTKINGEATISKVLDHFFNESIFSVEYVETCRNCSFISVTKKSYVPYSLNTDDLEQHIRNTVPAEVTCTQCQSDTMCNILNINSNLLILEPFDDLNQRAEYSCSLNSIKQKLCIFNKTYQLRGIVSHIGSNVGHFRAYCVRHNKRFELYDDLQKKKTDVSSTTIVNIQVLIYTS